MESYSSVVELIRAGDHRRHHLERRARGLERRLGRGAHRRRGVLGIVTPIVLYARPRALGTATMPIAALLVLIGGFLLRTVVILSSESVSWPG